MQFEIIKFQLVEQKEARHDQGIFRQMPGAMESAFHNGVPLRSGTQRTGRSYQRTNETTPTFFSREKKVGKEKRGVAPLRCRGLIVAAAPL